MIYIHISGQFETGKKKLFFFPVKLFCLPYACTRYFWMKEGTFSSSMEALMITSTL